MRRAIIVVLACSLLLPAGLLARAAADPVDVPGLEGPARVDRDANGIAHIRAGSRHDLFFLQGWVHAQDRLFQMDVRRRQAGGTLAELLGPAALATDVQLRTIGLHRAAARSLPALSADARAVLAAYADGVNAWVAGNPLPPEYGALSLTSFRPWTALDSVAVGKLQAFGLSFDLDIELTTALLGYQQAGQAAGFDGTALFFQDLWRSEPFTDASTVPDATGAAAATASAAGRAGRATGPAGERLAAAGRLAERYAALAAKVPLLRQALSQDRGQTGSNQWAVSGRPAAGGHPLLANDPHLALDSPSTFYPIQLQGARRRHGQRLRRHAEGDRRPQPPHLLGRHHQPHGRDRHLRRAGGVRPDVAQRPDHRVPGPEGAGDPHPRGLPPEQSRDGSPTTSTWCPRAGPSPRPP